MAKRIDWKTVIPQAATIADSYDPPPTLRQVFYRLVAAGIIPNTHIAYKTLSARSAEARRDGTFPPLTDGTRNVRRTETFTDPQDALVTIASWYRIDRTAGQESQVWVVVEKATLEALALSVVDRYGIPVVALRGYGSQTITDTLSHEMFDDGRPVVVLYLGDFDPTGEDIIRDLEERLTLPVDLRQVCVTKDQITRYGLVPMPGKTTDSRAAGFMARHGELVQVEVEAIDPDELKSLIGAAVEAAIDLDVWGQVLDQEEMERQTLEDAAL